MYKKITRCKEKFILENNYVITCCSTADMPKEYLDKRNIPYVCFHFVIDGKSYPDDLGETVKISDFYKMIADGAMPTTSQVNTDEFMQFFEPYLKDGKDILNDFLGRLEKTDRDIFEYLLSNRKEIRNYIQNRNYGLLRLLSNKRVKKYVRLFSSR